VFKKLSEIGVTLCLCSGRGIDIFLAVSIPNDRFGVNREIHANPKRGGGKYYNYT